MRSVLGNVLENYAQTRARLGGLAKNVGSPDQQALLRDLPRLFQRYLLQRGVADLYKVEGSIGLGNMARVPWVAIFNTAVTKSAEKGFYIVLLFAEDMSSCYLSLNQGITAVERLYTKSFAWKKMREAGLRAAGYLELHPEVIVGPINLKSTGDLGRGYESAAIESFRYSGSELPSNAVFFEHLDHLMLQYDTLRKKFGTDLYSLFEVSEDEFQQVVLEKAAFQSSLPPAPESAGGKQKATSAALGSQGFVRSPRVAADALRAANFSCEIDALHWTFTSRAKKKKYVEAHHLIPISQQPHFEFSLDVGANVVSLCATCHRLLHYGEATEKRPLLKSLLKVRKPRLREMEIDVADKAFLEFYGNGLRLDD